MAPEVIQVNKKIRESSDMKSVCVSPLKGSVPHKIV